MSPYRKSFAKWYCPRCHHRVKRPPLFGVDRVVFEAGALVVAIAIFLVVGFFADAVGVNAAWPWILALVIAAVLVMPLSHHRGRVICGNYGHTSSFEEVSANGWSAP